MKINISSVYFFTAKAQRRKGKVKIIIIGCVK